MEIVQPLLQGSKFRTQVLISPAAALEIATSPEGEACMKKLATFAQGGFKNYEGEENAAIRHETGRTFRIRHKASSLLRVLGFYTDDTKSVFVILDAVQKPSNGKYTSQQNKRMQAISNAAVNNDWVIGVEEIEEPDASAENAGGEST